MDDAVWHNVKRASRLLSLPEIYLRLKELLSDPDFALMEVSLLISQDPGITFRLLSIANSSLYSFKSKIETVSRAITLLGIQQVHDLVLATSVTRTFKGMSSDIMDMERFWRRSVYCGIASRQLASFCGHSKSEFLFLAGILHDVGHLILYQEAPELSEQAMHEAAEKEQPLFQAEQALFGFDYAGLTADMMRSWSLPESLSTTIQYQVEPARAPEFQLESALLHLGSVMAEEYDGQGLIGVAHLKIDENAWKITGLSLDDCKAVHEQAESDTQEIVNQIYSEETC